MDVNSQREIYLDNNATTQPLQEVKTAMLDVLGDAFGNPSSAHTSGIRALEHLVNAREAVATLITCDPETLIFTSGGTEANNMVLASAWSRHHDLPFRIITTQVEHSSILKYGEYLTSHGGEVVYVPVDCHGLISMSDLEAALTPTTILVSIQWVNNETGVIQPVEQIAHLCQSRSIPFHTDAAQAVGKLPLDISSLPIDFLSLTAHKFHGPQGAGALYVRDHNQLSPLFHGGPQENRRRAGTENVPGIVGMGKAAELRHHRLVQTQQQLGMLRDQFEDLLLETIPETEVNGDRKHRVCNTTNMMFRDIDGQALVAQLDQIGIRCSQSSACTNQHPEPSYVLRAMGRSQDEAYASVRFSVSEYNTADDIQWAAHQIHVICKRLRAFCRTGRRRLSIGVT